MVTDHWWLFMVIFSEPIHCMASRVKRENKRLFCASVYLCVYACRSKEVNMKNMKNMMR